ncbi:MAG: hypothetical protein WCF04_15585 [Candidatus Nanopelagicales bacterium]
MPGTLRIRGNGVWWVAEGTQEPVSLSGYPDPSPVTNAAVPKELTFGVMLTPITLRVLLDAGGCAELTVRRRDAEQVRGALNRRTAAGGPPAGGPRLGARAPIGPRLAVWLGFALLVAEEFSNPQTTLRRSVWFLAFTLGGVLMMHGRRMGESRAELVLTNRYSRNATVAAGRPAVGLVGGGSADLLPGATPSGVPLRYESMQATLAARCADEAWARRDRVDPRSWRQALNHRLRWRVLACLIGAFVAALIALCINYLLVGPLAFVEVGVRWGLVAFLAFVPIAVVGAVRSLTRARGVAGQVPGLRLRYLLARDWADDDHLILFPLVGDVAPIGVIELELPAAGAIPLAGTVELAGPTDPSTGRPGDGALIVPILDRRPLWPAGEFQVLEADELLELVTWEDPGEDPDDRDEVRSSVAGARP